MPACVHRAGARQRAAEALRILSDLCGDGAEGQAARRGLGLCACGLVDGGGPQGMVEDVGRTRAQQPERLRPARGRRGARTAQGSVHGLALIGAMAPGARECLRPPRRRGGVQRRHDNAGGSAGPPAVGLEPAAPWVGPGSRRSGARVRESAPGGRRLAMGRSPRPPLVLALPGGRAGGSSRAAPAGLAGEAQDDSRPAGGGDAVAARGGGTRPLAADEEGGLGPVAPQRGHQPDHAQRLVGARRARARTQGGCAQRRRRPCTKAARERAMVLRAMMRARQRLLALGGGIGVSAGEHHGSRGLGVTGAARVSAGLRKPREVLPVSVVCQTRKGRGTGALVGRLQGGALHPAVAYGVTAETLGVMGVRRPRGALREALGEEVAQRMGARGLMPLRTDRRRKALGQPNLTVTPAEQEGPTVCGEGPTLALCTHGLPADGRKAQVLWRSMAQKQTSGRFYEMDWTRLLFSQRLARGLCLFMKNSG